MKKQKITYWLPRVLVVLDICFYVLLSFDVFSANVSLIKNITGFIVQNIPSLILLLILLVSWKKEKIGGVLFLLAAVAFTFFFKTYGGWNSFFLISFPLILIGVLFLIDKNNR